MSPSPSHTTRINSTTSLNNFDNFPSPNNHVLNSNPSIIEEISRLSYNDDWHEVQSMLEILTTHERNNLKQNPN
jgi:hypothetical protein